MKGEGAKKESIFFIMSCKGAGAEEGIVFHVIIFRRVQRAAVYVRVCVRMCVCVCVCVINAPLSVSATTANRSIKLC